MNDRLIGGDYLFSFFKSLFCKHDYRHVRNLYGDAINRHDGKRSVWKCCKCGKLKFDEGLYK